MVARSTSDDTEVSDKWLISKWYERIGRKQVLVDMKSSLDRHIDRVVWNKEETEAKLSGRHVKGTFKVDDENLVIALNLSFVAKLAKGIIEKKIDEIIRQRLYDQPT